jgi:hypothetical protein
VTGPEKVVDAMIFPYMQVWRICLHVVSRDCQIHRGPRVVANISPTKKKRKKKGSQSSLFPSGLGAC